MPTLFPMTVAGLAETLSITRQHAHRLVAKHPELVLGRDERGYYELCPIEVHRFAIRRAAKAGR